MKVKKEGGGGGICVHASILSPDVTEEPELSARGEIVHHRRGAPRGRPKIMKARGGKQNYYRPFKKCIKQNALGKHLEKRAFHGV
ncbi:hypothetical protein CEXT_694381 [Caerostris extrusa]|uniref:Uncharacterized protein n=1 Tax=Caerostris extrusa TaxID=172846 RepID=A0AAV4Y345_CAEEX|nr:hypothetical protein CEXT_694381 [Caerostris extrusa]